MSASAADLESSASETRFTRAGRRIVYKVNVLQHPEKARACGQGPKSSTDRRPVDPPPIVDLRIVEEDGEGNEKDITYSYRANFFMFASIELARPIAQGRVPLKDQSTGPLLTGAPVSGISYLERPDPAGYFIFPDLSVRHEGRYRLAFTLYEEVRDPALDDRVDPPPSSTADPASQEHVYGRCVVKSKAFTVYSAKKFPGLSESTTLSRCVAEQGCRVRIRRDVRMRRRDTKDMSRSWEDDDDEGIDVGGARQPQQHRHYLGAATPEEHKPHHMPNAGYASAVETSSRPRSVSNVSTATYNPLQHRTSGSDINAKYQQGPSQHQMVPPHQQQQQQQQPGYPAQHPYEQHPPASSLPQHQYMHSQAVSQSPQHMHGFQPGPPSAPQYGYQQPYYPYQQHYGSYMTHQQIQSPIYPPQQSHLRHDNMNFVNPAQEYHPTPAPLQYSNTMPPSAPFGPVEAGHTRSTSLQAHPQQMTPNGTGRGQPPVPAMTTANPSQSSSMSQLYPGKSLPPLQTHPGISQAPGYDHTVMHSAPVTSAPSAQPLPPPYTSNPIDYRPPPPQYISGADSSAPAPKRSFGVTFPGHHANGRMQSGARPGDGLAEGLACTGVEGQASDEDDSEPVEMVYRRADGSYMKRHWPKVH